MPSSPHAFLTGCFAGRGLRGDLCVGRGVWVCDGGFVGCAELQQLKKAGHRPSAGGFGVGALEAEDADVFEADDSPRTGRAGGVGWVVSSLWLRPSRKRFRLHDVILSSRA